jgi:hypothetical protein
METYVGFPIIDNPNLSPLKVEGLFGRYSNELLAINKDYIWKRRTIMRDIIGTPVDLIIRLYRAVFKVGEGSEEEFIAIEFARFIEIAFCIIDVETGEEFFTEPIIHSLN